MSTLFDILLIEVLVGMGCFFMIFFYFLYLMQLRRQEDKPSLSMKVRKVPVRMSSMCNNEAETSRPTSEMTVERIRPVNFRKTDYTYEEKEIDPVPTEAVIVEV
jgi:hypothetical protein